MKIGLRTLKTALAAVFSFSLATVFHLSFAPSAAIISILSVGNTKRSTFITAKGRLASLAIATSISFVCFHFLGYNPLAFGLYLLVFISVSARLHLTEGIAVNSVLVTHFLLERSYSMAMIKNEFLLMSIGVGVALIANAYMPDTEKVIKQKLHLIEASFREILEELAYTLNRPVNHVLSDKCEQVLLLIRQGQKESLLHRENQWRSEDSYYDQYFSMRRSQVRLLMDMVNGLEGIQVEEILVEDLRLLLEFSANSFHEENDGKEILKRIELVYQVYRGNQLPKNRTEFENRARLFQFLQSFKSFIEIKSEFYESSGKSAV